MVLAAAPSARLRVRPALVAGLVLAALGTFLFLDQRALPIQLWDESRIAVNAIEMHQSGLSIVTTYGFAPDLWNTKPPLLVWLISGLMVLFGPSEWAVHAPSAVAALGTLLLVMGFTHRLTGSIWTAALAAVLLGLSVGFFGEHGARTGDYDALLTFFTTGYVCLLFFVVHRRRPAARWLLLAGLLIGAAALTKSVAGVIPGVGVAIYLVLQNRWRRPLRSPWYVAAAALAVAPVLAFVLLREASAPGYLAAVWGNDVSGRFMTALDQHDGPPWYYVEALFADYLFSAGLLTLLAPAALIRARGKARAGLLFSLVIAAVFLGVISLSSTKLPQYAAPAIPFVAIAAALAVREGLRAAANAPGSTRHLAHAVVAVALGGVVAQAVVFRHQVLAERAFVHQALYGELFTQLARSGVAEVQVLDRGIDDIGVPAGYSPQLRFYTLLWAERGLAARHVTTFSPAPGFVASCDEGYAAQLRRLGPDLAAVPGCAAVQVSRSRPAA